ncbi:MAG: beta-ketoacyl synthase N-terminal-like domain-containing protein [Tepidisphaeraceae bacterium]
MSRIPIITGIGLVSPLATGADATWRALLEGRYITQHARTVLDATSPTRVNTLALAAAREAVGDARWPSDDRAGAALVVGTSKGAVEGWLTAPPQHISQSTYDLAGVSCADFGLASVAAAVREGLPLLDGPSLTLSAACSSGLHALIRAGMMIQSGEAERVLVVAAEASVHPLFIGSFQRLGVLPKEGIGCRPFDANRDGFLMSEAAAAVCLEGAETRPHERIYARVDRFGMGGDATHLTGGDPEAKLLRRLLARVADNQPIDLVHAHGTGTVINDPIELRAIDETIAGEPNLISHKGALGHSLGAAGLVSIVLNCLSHARGVVPPNVRTPEPLPATHVRIARDAVSRPIRKSLAIAAGFGGPVAVVGLRS